MSKIGIFRCQGNEKKCPLTNCLLSLQQGKQAFSSYDEVELYGVFSLQEDFEENVNLANIMKSKGVEVIHIVTCAFSNKSSGKNWELGGGYCSNVDSLAEKIARETGLPCVKGTAHLPQEYELESFT